jgi:RecG-like helicase
VDVINASLMTKWSVWGYCNDQLRGCVAWQAALNKAMCVLITPLRWAKSHGRGLESDFENTDGFEIAAVDLAAARPWRVSWGTSIRARQPLRFRRS